MVVMQPSLGWLITPVGKDWVSLSTQSYLDQHRLSFLSQATVTFDTLACLREAEKEQISGDLELTQTLKGREVSWNHSHQANYYGCIWTHLNADFVCRIFVTFNVCKELLDSLFYLCSFIFLTVFFFFFRFSLFPDYPEVSLRKEMECHNTTLGNPKQPLCKYYFPSPVEIQQPAC